MSFMISRETENVQSLSEVISSFRAIMANADRAYVTIDEIQQVRPDLHMQAKHSELASENLIPIAKHAC